jgi:threonine dehydrogenase-like Zn-dependent dehydrogenase
MRAVVFRRAEEVAVEDVPEPAVEEPEDAIVRVTRTAICGSDLHIYHGKAPIEPGDVMGHEAVGVVEGVGHDVERFHPGDRVIASFVVACGSCWFCRSGQTSLCEDLRMPGTGIFGGDLPGAQAELLRIPRADVNLLSVPEGVDDERALFVGDVLTAGYYAASCGGLGADDVVAVLGAGPLGYCAALAARALGARHVAVLDRDPERLVLPAAAGLDTVDVSARHPASALAQLTEGRGADVVIEAVGTPEAYETAVDIVRRGGTVVVVGVFAGESVELQLGVYWARGITVRFAGICPVHAWWEAVMTELAASRLDPLPVVSHRLPLEDAPEGYRLFDDRRASKVLLSP